MGETKHCPCCGEPIQKIAQKCKWCGEWLDNDKHSSNISCPICGEQIPRESKVCPFCKESVSGISFCNNTTASSKSKIRSLYVIIGVMAVLGLIAGGVVLKNYSNDKEIEERVNDNPYSIISKNLAEAVNNGRMLNSFLRDEKNVEALKKHFGEDVYSLILALSFYSDEPLFENHPKDHYAGGYAWRTAGDKGKYGCRLVVGPDKFDCKFYYDGMEVDRFGQIVRNNHWHCDYYKDDFNEYDETRPYIEQIFQMDENSDRHCTIRLDNRMGVAFLVDVPYFDQILLRNNDTGEVWNLPLNKVSSIIAVLLTEGQEKFLNWFQTANSITLSAIDSTGQYTPSTVTLDCDEMKFYDTYMSHVMKKQIHDKIFVKHDFN